jgi:radical SAM superfamily enzyme YgiQ (UPF0313 family)
MFRKNNEVCWNKSDAIVHLDTVPLPSYDSFYKELASTSHDIQQYYQYYGRLPVEISRGCWWNQCTFCSLNIQHRCYREKSVSRIVQEIRCLSERYRMMDFQLIGNTLPKIDYRTLFEKLKSLGRDFSFFVEARAGQLTSDDYTSMKEAGFTTIQTGIESFSQKYLLKMNKGVRVIDNIAVLKFCKENGIRNSYNLIIRYPNEELEDFEETKKIVNMLKEYLDPPQLCELRVMHGSYIQRCPEQFNIERLEYASIDKIMYPLEYLEKGFTFVYDFKRMKQTENYPWESLVEDWKKQREIRERGGCVQRSSVDPLVFYFVDGGSFIKIYDKRDLKNIKIFVLNELERQVFLNCIDIISFGELKRKFIDVPEFELTAILQSFEKNELLFCEDQYYLCLPLRVSVRKHPEIWTESQVNIAV